MGSDVAIHFSRLGVNNISDTLFMAWTMAGLWAAGATGNPLAYAAAGFGLGFGQYYYFGARAIPFVVAANVLVWLVADRRGVWRARYLLLGGLLVTLVVAEPLIGYWLRTPGSISQHMDLTVPFSSFMQEKAVQLVCPSASSGGSRSAIACLFLPCCRTEGTFYNPPQALLHPLQAPFFLVGLLVVFARWRRPINQGLLAWGLIVLTLGSVLMNHPAKLSSASGYPADGDRHRGDWYRRGADALTKAIRWHPGRVAWSRRASHIIAGGALVILTAATINYYFRIYNLRVSFKSPNQEAVTIAALEYEHQHGQGTFLLCTQDTVDAEGKVYHPPIVYVAGAAFRGCAPAIVDQIGVQRPLYFYFLTDQFDAIPHYVARFPGGSLKNYYRRADGQKIMTCDVVEAWRREGQSSDDAHGAITRRRSLCACIARAGHLLGASPTEHAGRSNIKHNDRSAFFRVRDDHQGEGAGLPAGRGGDQLHATYPRTSGWRQSQSCSSLRSVICWFLGPLVAARAGRREDIATLYWLILRSQGAYYSWSLRMTDSKANKEAGPASTTVRRRVCGRVAAQTSRAVLDPVRDLVGRGLPASQPPQLGLGTHVHPDENFLTMVSSAMGLPSSPPSFLTAPIAHEPLQQRVRLFVYGTSAASFIVRVVASSSHNSTKLAK